MRPFYPILSVLVTFFSYFTFVSPTYAEKTQNIIVDRDKLICGINREMTPFALPKDQDFFFQYAHKLCQAYANVLLGDKKKVIYTPLNTTEQFQALIDKKIDILPLASLFYVPTQEKFLNQVTTIYNDNLVKLEKKAEEERITDNPQQCLYMPTQEVKKLGNILPNIHFSTNNFFELKEKLDDGECKIAIMPKSTAYMLQYKEKNISSYAINEENILSVPYGPIIRQEDDHFHDIVQWVIQGLVEMEEKGINRNNIEQFDTTTDLSLTRLLGRTKLIGAKLNLSPRWLYRLTKNIGNYGDIYSETLGQNSLLKMKRTKENIWIKKGLLYALPIR